MKKSLIGIVAVLLIMIIGTNARTDGLHEELEKNISNKNTILKIAGWDVYSDPTNLNKTIGFRSFEKAHDVEIQYTPLNNLDAIIEAAESKEQYDLIIISNEGVKTLHDMKLVLPLNLDKLPEYGNLHPSLKYNEWSQFKSRIFAIPWAWGPTGLMYDADKLPTPDSWEVLWDHKYTGRTALWDDFSMIWITALTLGFDNVYNLTKPQLNKVKEKLFHLNEHIHGYYEGKEQELNYIRHDNILLLNSWFDPSRQLLKEGRNFKMVVPKEGAVGMFDSYLIGTNTKYENMAYHFINHQISPSVQVEMVRITGLAPANMLALSKMPKSEINALHLDELNYFEQMILWNVMPRRHLYEALLKEVKENFKNRKKDVNHGK
ncbi:MAG: extracellular solute-binding protein [Magnetococcales bacterium]|nr:extracellular solute-binding protein [Magnetococcales bacterium]